MAGLSEDGRETSSEVLVNEQLQAESASGKYSSR